MNNRSSRDLIVKTCMHRLLQNGSQTIQITANSPALPTTNLSSTLTSNISFNSFFITPSKVEEVIAARNNKPSAGVDTMPNCLIKLFDKKLFVFISVLFNQIIAAGHFPSCWKHAIVVPIPKAGKSISNVGNWRPISLLNSLSKIFERIIAQRIYDFNNENQVIPYHQFGFQSAHSTCHPLAILQNQVNEGLNNGLITTVVSLDIRAAFDTVWHDGLIFKLNQLKFPKYLIFIINSFLRNRSFKIKFSNIFSDSFNIPAGVPQGSVLGPILFNISTFDIPLFHNFRLLQYADDTAILISYPRIHRIESSINLYLECLANWYDSWKFQLNASKTELIHFVGTQKHVSWLRRKRLREMTIKLNGVVIQPKSDIRYLGVYFSRNNRFNHHVDTILQKTIAAKARLGGLIHSQLLKTDFKKYLYTVYLRPLITYASPIWMNPSQITSYQMERCRVLERKLIRSTHNIYRKRHSYKFLNNRKLYEVYKGQRIDVFMAKLNINFHLRCANHLNPEIRKLYSVYETNDNLTYGHFLRTDYIINLHENGMLFDTTTNELCLFNRKKLSPEETVYSLAQ